jgi:hypothetical protein
LVISASLIVNHCPTSLELDRRHYLFPRIPGTAPCPNAGHRSAGLPDGSDPSPPAGFRSPTRSLFRPGFTRTPTSAALGSGRNSQSSRGSLAGPATTIGIDHLGTSVAADVAASDHRFFPAPRACLRVHLGLSAAGRVPAKIEQQSVLIVPWQYEESGVEVPGADNFPLPMATRMWRGTTEGTTQPGGESHAYMLHHWLEHHLVTPKAPLLYPPRLVSSVCPRHTTLGWRQQSLINGNFPCPVSPIARLRSGVRFR